MPNTTSRLKLPYIVQSQSQKEVTHNAGLDLLDTLFQPTALSVGLNTPPASPSSGDCYILGSSPTGAWLGQAKAFAFYTTVWNFLPPWEGFTVWASDTNILYTYDGSSWLLTPSSVRNSTPCEGRLTLRAGYPVPDVSGGSEDGYSITGSTVYFTPYFGNKVALHYTASNSSSYVYDFSQMSLVLPSTAHKNYDIFLEASAPSFGSYTLSLSYSAWASDTARTDVVAITNGMYVMQSTPTKRYLGTVRVNSSGVMADTPAQRFVWNMYNRLHRQGKISDATASWSYTTASWRYANNNSANKIEFVIGFNEDPVHAVARARAGAASLITVGVGIGIDTATAPTVYNQFLAPSTGQNSGTAIFDGYVGVQGYHTLTLCEYGHGTTAATFYGCSGYATWFTGLTATLRC